MPNVSDRLKLMARRLDWSDWLLWFGVGSYSAYNFIQAPGPTRGLLAVLLFGTGVCQLLASRWTWHAGLVSFGYLTLLTLGSLFTAGVTVMRLVLCAACAWCVWKRYTEREKFQALTESAEDSDALAPPVDSDDEDKRPAHSLVLWLREPLYLDAAILGRIATQAYGVPFNENEDSHAFVVGKERNHILCVENAWFLIHHWDRSYFDDPEAAAGDLRELRRAEAVSGHRAWVAMDFMQPKDGIGMDRVHALIGTLLAGLCAAGAEVLAVYHPATGRIAPWEPGLREKLASGEPLTVFEELEQVPVIRVSGDAPAMVAAVAEARRRWPEFLAAFHATADRERFSIKAPVTEAGRTEFIWIKVKAIADGQIHGFLANDPVALGELKLGDFVSVAESDINDWVCPDPADSRRPLGLFTVKAVHAGGAGES